MTKKKHDAVGKRLAVERLRQAREEIKSYKKRIEQQQDEILALIRRYRLMINFMVARMTETKLAACLESACERLAKEPCDRCAP